jgi:hypothetical protein
MLRGLALAAAMVVVRLLQGTMINAWQEWAMWISVILLLLFILGAAVWGVRDGRADAIANRDPDRWCTRGSTPGACSTR